PSVYIGRRRLASVPECPDLRFRQLPGFALDFPLPALHGSDAGQVAVRAWPHAKPVVPVALHPVVLVEGALEDIQQAVIVALRDRIELVAMTASALHGQAQDGRAEHIDLIGNYLEAVWNEVGEVEPGRVGSHAQEA